MLVLAIEASTSSAKALLYDPEKGVVDSAQETYGPEIGVPGKTDTEGVYQLSMRMARKVAEGKDIEAVALCCTWHSLTIMDRDMKPLIPTHLWNCTDTAYITDEIRKDEELTKRFYQNTGCMPHNTFPRHIITMFRERGMDMKDKIFATQGGYNFYRMTGEFMETQNVQAGTGVINTWQKFYDAWVMDYLGVRKSQFGELCTYKDVRPLNQEAADLLGIKAGIPVVPAHSDGALNQLGNFASREGIMTMSMGTSGAIRLRTKKPVLPSGHQLWCYVGVHDYLTGAAIAGACNCVDWFMKVMLGGKMSFSDLEAVEDEDKDTPVFMPFNFAERCPGWIGERRGGFAMLEGNTTLPEMYKAIQMATLFNLYQCYEVLIKEVEEPREIIISGGIVNSKKWLQMAADIFQKNLKVADFPNASCMGAIALALNAAGALDNIDDFRADYDSAIPLDYNADRKEYYDRQYRRYLEVYEKTK